MKQKHLTHNVTGTVSISVNTQACVSSLFMVKERDLEINSDKIRRKKQQGFTDTFSTHCLCGSLSLPLSLSHPLSFSTTHTHIQGVVVLLSSLLCENDCKPVSRPSHTPFSRAAVEERICDVKTHTLTHAHI